MPKEEATTAPTLIKC